MRRCPSEIFFGAGFISSSGTLFVTASNVGEIRRVGEAVKHRRGRGVHLVHRRQAEHQFHRAQQAGVIVLRADDGVALGLGAGDIGRGAIAADVIPAILRIVLDGEQAGVRPEFAMAHGVDDLPQREVVVGHLRGGRGLARAGAAGVVVRQPDDDEVRQIVRCFILLQSLMNCAARQTSGTFKSQPIVLVTKNGRNASMSGSLV